MLRRECPLIGPCSVGCRQLLSRSLWLLAPSSRTSFLLHYSCWMHLRKASEIMPAQGHEQLSQPASCPNSFKKSQSLLTEDDGVFGSTALSKIFISFLSIRLFSCVPAASTTSLGGHVFPRLAKGDYWLVQLLRHHALGTVATPIILSQTMFQSVVWLKVLLNFIFYQMKIKNSPIFQP